jgi:PBSX family phage portal protein
MNDLSFDEIAECGLGDRIPLIKTQVLGSDTQPSNVQPVERRVTDERIFSKEGALAPPYGPEVLTKIFEHSNSLRQNIDAYCVNIDGNGHRFEPVIDLDEDDAFDKVKDAIFLERIEEAELEGEEISELDFPTDEEIEERIETIREEMRIEKAKLEVFFKFCSIDESFVSLRKRTRQDKEIMGSGYWEVIRNGVGDPVQFNYIPGFTIRLLPLDNELVEVDMGIKKTPFTYSTIKVSRRFRKFVQVFEKTKVFFKEYGDPRVISAARGHVYKDVGQLEAEEGKGARQATEIIHYSIHSPRSPYGIPRWIGTLLAVLGSRQSEEVNFLYFENKSVPPLAVLVSGGSLSQNSTKRLEDYIENKIKGRKNFHKILVIEGVPSQSAALDAMGAKVKVEIVPLTMSQQKDALFQKYDERNIDKIGMSFRLPRLLRGDIRDFNRATAEAALEFAEMQVFSPEREDFDWFVNRKILSELGIKYWVFVSNAPTTRNPLDLSKIISDLVKESILTPEEARELSKGIFNRDFKKIDELWVKIPPNLLKAGILPEGEGVLELPGEGDDLDLDDPDPDDPDPDDPDDKKSTPKKISQPSVSKRYRSASRSRNLRRFAKDLIDLRALLDQAERQEARTSYNRSHEEENIEKEILKVPEHELTQFLE